MHYIKKGKEIADKTKQKVFKYQGLEIWVWLNYEPDIFYRNWVVKLIIYKGVLPVYIMTFRFWRYSSALSKYNELIDKLDELLNKMDEIISKFNEGPMLPCLDAAGMTPCAHTARTGLSIRPPWDEGRCTKGSREPDQPPDPGRQGESQVRWLNEG